MSTALFGFSEIDITPTRPVQMVGFGRRDETSRGVLHSLTAQVSVWEFEGEKFCIIAVDHIGFFSSNAFRLRDVIAHQIGTTRDHVMICFSHTHSAPNDSREVAYYQFVCQQIRTAVWKAVNDLSPVLAGWINAYADIGMNRLSETGAVDNRIGILKVVDAESHRLKFLLLRVTAHANVLKEDNYLLTPDYFGTTRDLLEKEFGCKVMMTQGASGNIAPRFYSIHSAHPYPYFGRTSSSTALMDMAKEILMAVGDKLSSCPVSEVTRLRMKAAGTVLHSRILSYGQALQIAADAKRIGIDGTAWLQEVRRLTSNGVSEQLENVEVQYFTLNEGTICGVSNEISTELAIEASRKLGNSLFYLGGYTNGGMSYLSTAEEYDNGGYDVYWSLLIYFPYFGRVFPLNRESAELLVDFVCANAE